MSAAIDGANALQKFRYITLPMIAPFLMVAVIIRTIDALKSFDIIYAITQGGPARRRRPSTSTSTAWPSPITTSATARPSRWCSSRSSSACRCSCSMSASGPNGPSWEGAVNGTRGASRQGRSLVCGARAGVAGGAVLPLDAVAVAQVRGRQRRLSADPDPERIAWKNYVGVVESNRFGLFFVNSLIVTGAATGLALLIGIRPDTASPACAPRRPR